MTPVFKKGKIQKTGVPRGNRDFGLFGETAGLLRSKFKKTENRERTQASR